jgi:hypothetical protein
LFLFLLFGFLEAAEVALAAAAAFWAAGGCFQFLVVSVFLPPLFRREGWELVDVPFAELFWDRD